MAENVPIIFDRIDITSINCVDFGIKISVEEEEILAMQELLEGVDSQELLRQLPGYDSMPADLVDRIKMAIANEGH